MAKPRKRRERGRKGGREEGEIFDTSISRTRTTRHEVPQKGASDMRCSRRAEIALETSGLFVIEDWEKVHLFQLHPQSAPRNGCCLDLVGTVGIYLIV